MIAVKLNLYYSSISTTSSGNYVFKFNKLAPSLDKFSGFQSPRVVSYKIFLQLKTLTYSKEKIDCSENTVDQIHC